MKKIQGFKRCLKEWNLNVFGIFSLKLKSLEDELHVLELKANESELNVNTLQKRREVRTAMQRLKKKKEWMWLQKSRLST